MLRGLNNLNSDVVADFEAHICWHPHLWKAELPAVYAVIWPANLEGMHNWMRIVRGRCAALWCDTDVHIEEGLLMSCKPSWLYRKCAAAHRPFCAILGHRHATACTY